MRITKKLVKELEADTRKVLEGLSTDDIVKLLQKANQEYYNGDAPILSDKAYDILKDVMEERDPSHPILKSVGAVIAKDDDRKANLPYFLASLDKIKTDPKVLEKWKTKYKGECVVSDKLDGVSGLLTFNGGCVALYTRGDGQVGQKINHLLPFIKGIPPLLLGDKEVSVRGELIISKKDFETIKHKGANARNMISGLVNAKVPDLEVAKVTQFVAYELIVPQTLPSQSFKIMNDYGFNIVHREVVSDVSVSSLSEILLRRRKESDFEVDGVVIMHNKVYERVKQNPGYAFAFKSAEMLDAVEVFVSHVEWNISKDGYFKPVVVFPGVKLSGVMIQRVTAFNAKFVEDNIIGKGARLMIIRSGDVIPYISQVVSPATSGKADMPTDPYVWNETRVDVMVAKENDDVRFKNIEFFIKKVEVKGLAAGTLKKMFDSGLQTVHDILHVSKDMLLKVPGIKDKMANNIWQALQASKANMDCLTVMDASNAFGRGLGLKKLELIVGKFPATIHNRITPTVGELVKIRGVEKTTAEQFIKQLPLFWKFLDDNGLSGLCTADESSTTTTDTQTQNDKLKGVKVVFSGFRDAGLEAVIKKQGGDVATTVSKNTTVVVVKELGGSSSKVTKANELGIPVVILEDFRKAYMS